MLTVYKQITIQTLNKQGIKKRQIAAQLNCHRNTVYNVLNRAQVIEKQTRHKGSAFDFCKEQIKKWLKQKISRVRIYEMIREEYGIKGSYDNLCKYIQKYFPRPVTAYGVQITKPGEEAELDFGYLGLLPNPEGKRVKTWGIAIILSFSRFGYWAITYDQKLETLIKHLKLAFAYFTGVPARLKIDNMRTAILNNQHYQLEYNQDFLEFSQHYGTVIVPCTPYHPEQKGKVEAGIKYLQGNFVNGRQFTHGYDLALKLKEWRDNYANLRIHGSTKKIPWQVWKDEEKSKLQALPEEDFSFFNRGIRKVASHCHIHFNSSYYSVPAALVGKEVTVRYNDSLVRIIYQGEQVALHRQAKQAGEYVTVRSHLPNYKIYSQTEYQAYYERKMANIGEAAHRYFQQLLLTKEGYWSRTVKGILGLTEEYGKEAMEASLTRALYFQATDLATIRNIVSHHLYKTALEPRLPMNRENSLTRDLSYYRL